MIRSLPRRRILGVIFLAVAIGQVAAGFTVLDGKLEPLTTLLYWTACMAATLGAVLCALADALRSLVESRQERRGLLEQTLREIDEERARRQREK
jgi:hypothetical protein